MAEPRLTFKDVEEFLAWEELQDERHEYVHGVVRMMTGGTAHHALIQANLVAELRDKLRGSPCRAFGSDLRVRVSRAETRFPDAMVVCALPSGNDTITSSPVLLVEVLSPSSAAVDLGDKVWSYPTIPSLEHYLVLWQTAPRAELWSRSGATTPEGWTRRQFIGLETVVPLPALAIDLKLADLYEGLTLE